VEGIGGRRKIKRNMMFENQDERYDHGKNIFISCMIRSSVALYYIDLWAWSPELEEFSASLFQTEQQTGKLV
jgi:hypothetical protein